jgi:poly(3-hydroxybutyrate) depolymerase
LNAADFTVTLGGVPLTITNVWATDNRVLITHWGTSVVNNQTVKVSYTGTSIKTSSSDVAAPFSNVTATTGPATLNSLSAATDLRDNTFPSPDLPDTYVYRGSTATGTPPLVICALHDHGVATETRTSWIEAADKYGLCVALIDASDGLTASTSTPYPMSTHADWFRGRIPTWVSTTGADSNNVYLAGWSAGGWFAFFCALAYTKAQMPLAGIAVKCGKANLTRPATIVRDAPCSLLLDIGSADSTTTLHNDSTYYGFYEELAMFAGFNGTASNTVLSNAHDDFSIVQSYGGFVDGSVLNGGQHYWSGEPNAPGVDSHYKFTDKVAQWVWASATPSTSGTGGTVEHEADTGSYYWRSALNGPFNTSFYDSAQTRPLSADQYDRAEVIYDNTSYQAGTDSWYTMALWLPSWSNTTSGAFNFISLAELNYHGLGLGSDGPTMLKVINNNGVPNLRMEIISGWADSVNTPAYQYNSATGFGFPGGAIPNTDIVGGGATGTTLDIGVWHELIHHFHWSTGTDGVYECWWRKKGTTSWTKTLSLTGVATLQWPRTAGDTITNATYNANYTAGLDSTGAYRHYSTSPLSPTWNVDIDTWDSTTLSPSLTSLAACQARFG